MNIRASNGPSGLVSHLAPGSCGAKFETRSTAGGELHVELCSQCHPFYTGTQKLVDSGGRVQRFSDKFGNAAKAVQEREAADKDARLKAAEEEAEEARKAREEREVARAAKEAKEAERAKAKARKDKARKKPDEPATEEAPAEEAPAEEVVAEAAEAVEEIEAPAEEAPEAPAEEAAEPAAEDTNE